MDRRRFLSIPLTLLPGSRALGVPGPTRRLRLFLAGDVMTGRGVDQILPHPGDPAIHEPYARSALDYLRLAERASGPIPRPAGFDYVWGDALAALAQARPDARIVNLETAVTRSDDWWPGKGINYRMSPGNVRCLTAAGIDACALANNHVLDWGYEGLAETLDALQRAGIRTAGAGADREAAAAPAVVDVAGGRRVILVSVGSRSSGVPGAWEASDDRPGIHLLDGRRPAGVEEIGERIARLKRPGDLAVLSVHWGGNWGYEIPDEARALAHAWIDRAGVDVVHGHSSHHPIGIEVYRGKLVLYGCGDFLNDYEGISGHEAYRGDLALMYLPDLDPATGRLSALQMRPFRLRRFRLEQASETDAAWLAGTLERESRPLGAGVSLERGSLRLQWSGGGAGDSAPA